MGVPMRGVVDRKGELFAYLKGDTLYTLDDEATGRRKGDFILDLKGNPVWRIVGDALYSLDEMESIGYLSAERDENI